MQEYVVQERWDIAGKPLGSCKVNWDIFNLKNVHHFHGSTNPPDIFFLTHYNLVEYGDNEKRNWFQVPEHFTDSDLDKNSCWIVGDSVPPFRYNSTHSFEESLEVSLIKGLKIKSMKFAVEDSTVSSNVIR